MKYLNKYVIRNQSPAITAVPSTEVNFAGNVPFSFSGQNRIYVNCFQPYRKQMPLSNAYDIVYHSAVSAVVQGTVICVLIGNDKINVEIIELKSLEYFQKRTLSAFQISRYQVLAQSPRLRLSSSSGILLHPLIKNLPYFPIFSVIF